VAGDFNQWDDRSIPMEKKNNHEWTAVMQLPSGRYEFKYIADGRWVEEVPDMEMVPNSYGTYNFVLNVS
jgi:1,4-alpha-glucan branching enzyme